MKMNENSWSIIHHSLSAEGGDDEGHGGGSEEGEVRVDHGAMERVVARQHCVETAKFGFMVCVLCGGKNLSNHTLTLTYLGQ